jgi:hypothetical protein
VFSKTSVLLLFRNGLIPLLQTGILVINKVSVVTLLVSIPVTDVVPV